MRIVILVSFVSALALAPLAGCGGGTASNDNLETTPGAAPVADSPAEAASGGTAAAGADCDFGGAERYTCQGGLECCYPEEGEVAYGTCQSSCPGYD